MIKIKIDAYALLRRIKKQRPLIHHLTNWVTIYGCANIVKAIGGSPVMAHAKEEVAEMAGMASALVLNTGTITVDFLRAMKIAARSANKKGIPVILDACGAGATIFRDKSCFQLLNDVRVDILKGNVSEIARIAGEDVRTKGVDSTRIKIDMRRLARGLALKRRCTVVVTGQEDIVCDGQKTFIIKNGHPMMGYMVGTGCMAASVIATFAAVEKDSAHAAVCGLLCFEVAAECAAKKSKGPGSFKDNLYDCMYALDKRMISRMQKVYQ
ncbi:MAG: hydroxyethylthiazole kinase [Candidatus Omnitrophota bacterium]